MTKENLVDDLINAGYLKTPLIIEAFEKIDRADFVPEELKSEAYGNYPLPLGSGQTISQPLTVAFMLELLQPQPGEKILDIGSGSGWQTALLAYIVSKSQISADSHADERRYIGANQSGNQRKSALVIAIERIPELNAMTEKNVSKYTPAMTSSGEVGRGNFIEKGIVRAVLGDGSNGFPEEEPFDKIIAAAAIQNQRSSASYRRESAVGDIPDEWKRQVKIGGRIVTPIRGSIFVFDKVSEDRFEEKEYPGFSFVPLIKE